MNVAGGKRSILVLYSGKEDVFSHQVRIVLAEKDIAVEINYLDEQDPKHSEFIAELNPYGKLPVLVDRDLVLYGSRVILEYLDERFPHPPLLPVYPSARAKIRLMMDMIQNEWYPVVDKVLNEERGYVTARKEFKENLLSLEPLFEEMPYFMSNEFSLLDCYLAPLFWRLSYLGIEIEGKNSIPIKKYQVRLVERPSFVASLTDAERQMVSLYS